VDLLVVGHAEISTQYMCSGTKNTVQDKQEKFLLAILFSNLR
jgi:hypothetical protein